MRSLAPLLVRSLALFGTLAFFAPACQGDFAPPSEIQGLRVLAVRPEPASGSPGATVQLEMLVADSRPPVADEHGELHPPPVDIAWLGGCHNPPSRQYYACLPALRRLSEDPALVASDPSLLDEVKLHAGTSFDERLPADILSAAPKLPTDSVHFGVSYVFFAVCTGKLDIGGASEFPLTCTDADGNAIGPSGFVIGFTTIYAFEDAVNQNPVLTGVDFDRSPVFASSPDAFSELPVVDEGAGGAGSDGNAKTSASSAGADNGGTDGGGAGEACLALSGGTPDGGALADGTHLRCCATDSDCAGVSFAHPAVCSANQVCAPLVAGCSGSACPGLRVAPHFDATGIESSSGGNEIVWASYYATRGSFDSSARLVVDRENGLTSDYSAIWKPPAADPHGARHTARLWVALNDQRGGASWGFFDVVVE